MKSYKLRHCPSNTCEMDFQKRQQQYNVCFFQFGPKKVKKAPSRALCFCQLQKVSAVRDKLTLTVALLIEHGRFLYS